MENTTHTAYSNKLLQALTSSLFITIPQTTINYQELHTELSNYKHTKYLITKLEQHEDKGRHIHIVIQLERNIRISAIHNIIKAQDGEQTGMIDYEKPKHIGKSINYLKKEETSVEGHPYLEYGEQPKMSVRQQNEDKEALLEALKKAAEGNTEEALEDIKNIDPMKYIQYKQQITENLTTENKTIKKYDLPSFDIKDVTLKPKQQQVWDLLQETPKARRIIWVSGQYGSGKSHLFNYINKNHSYGMYNAGQTASYDKVYHAYNEEGVIAWDLPRTFDFDNLGNYLTSVIEKASDFGQTVSANYRTNKTQFIRGHCIVFSNRKPLDTLKHRDIVHIDLSQNDEEEQEVQTAPILFTDIQYHKEPTSVVVYDSSDDEDEYKTVTATNKPHIKIVSKKNKKGMTSAIYKYLVQLRSPTGNIVSKPLDTFEEAVAYCPEGYTYP